MKTTLIAPCGMNCGLCAAYLRDKNTCPGCRLLDDDESQYRRTCIIRNCAVCKETRRKFCSNRCQQYPCKRLKSLDKRYRTRYGMSMIDNLEAIEKVGVRQFVKQQKEKWACKTCGKFLCVHKKACLYCGGKR